MKENKIMIIYITSSGWGASATGTGPGKGTGTGSSAGGPSPSNYLQLNHLCSFPKQMEANWPSVSPRLRPFAIALRKSGSDHVAKAIGCHDMSPKCCCSNWLHFVFPPGDELCQSLPAYDAICVLHYALNFPLNPNHNVAEYTCSKFTLMQLIGSELCKPNL